MRKKIKEVNHHIICTLCSANDEPCWMWREFAADDIFITNEYNEQIILMDSGNDYNGEPGSKGTTYFSDDQMTLFFERNDSTHFQNLAEDKEMYCYQYKEGVIIWVGGVEDYNYPDENGDNVHVEYYFFGATPDSYMVKNPHIENNFSNEVNYDEFKAQRDTLMKW